MLWLSHNRETEGKVNSRVETKSGVQEQHHGFFVYCVCLVFSEILVLFIDN